MDDLQNRIDTSGLLRQIADVQKMVGKLTSMPSMFATGDPDFGSRFGDRRFSVHEPATLVCAERSPQTSALLDSITALQRAMPVVAPELKFVANDLMTVTVEDWSEVRSHGRAARRRRQGHRQRIRYVQKPDPKMYSMPDGTTAGHSATIDAAMRLVQVEAWKRSERIAEELLWGRRA